MVAHRFLTGSFELVDDAATLHASLKPQLTSSTKPNVLMVIVEGLGAFKDTKKQDLIWGPLVEISVNDGYVVQTGYTQYFGSTSSAEARELCNRFGDYRDFRERGNLDCLPRLALKSGYNTAAFHTFSGTFFERLDWYPKVGFQELKIVSL